MINKLLPSALEAVRQIPDGAVILCGGFASCGFADELLEALYVQGTRELTLVANNPQVAERGMALLLRDGRLKKLICSYSRKEGTSLIEDLMAQGLQLEIVPQGTLAERIRSHGAGIAGFYTRAGVGTPLAQGKEHREFDGHTYLFETALKADFAFVRAKAGDRWGNLVYDKTARNFNAVMAMGGAHTIAQVDEQVELGALDPENIITPGIFVKQLVVTRQR